MQKSLWLGDRAFGVVELRNGFGIRALADSYEEIAKELRPADFSRFVGTRWCASGLPWNFSSHSSLKVVAPVWWLCRN